MSFLRPVPMTRIGVIGLKDQQESILTVLHDLGVVQIEPIGPEAARYLEPERAGEVQRAVGDQLIRFRGLKSALPPTPVSSPRHFVSRQEVFETAKTVPIDDEVGHLQRNEDRLLTEEKSLRDTSDLLEKFRFYNDRLEYLTAEHVLAFFGEAKPEVYAGLRSEIRALSDSQFFEQMSGKAVRFIVAVRSEQADAIGRLAQQKGVTLTVAPKVTGTVAEAIPRLIAERERVDAELVRVRERLREISVQWYGLVAALEEAFMIEARKLDVYTELGTQLNSFALEGWVPTRSRASLEAAVDRVSGGRAVFYDAPAHAEAPTLMDNPKGVRRFELFIRFYSLPRSTEWDPTWIFALAFPIFFGFMLGDWGFGLAILLISIWMILGFPGGQYLPKWPKNFVKMIVGPEGMRNLAYALIPGCLVAIGFGLYADLFFGGHPFAMYFHYASIDFSQKVALLLGISVLFGLAMVTLGFGLGALHAYYLHHRRAVLGKVGGILVAVGVFGIFAPILSTGAGLFPWGLSSLIYWVVPIVVGAALLVYGEGGQMGGIESLEVLSHVLSYARLAGILLAGVVLAGLVVQFALAWIGTTGPWAAVWIPLGVVLLIFGLGFSLILAVFEPGIQGARLIFVEHFSKYYEGNGRVFAPFGSRRAHTLPASIEAVGQATPSGSGPT